MPPTPPPRPAPRSTPARAVPTSKPPFFTDAPRRRGHRDLSSSSRSPNNRHAAGDATTPNTAGSADTRGKSVQRAPASAGRTHCDLLDLEEAIIADSNASSDYASFHSEPERPAEIDGHTTFLGDLRHAKSVRILQSYAPNVR